MKLITDVIAERSAATCRASFILSEPKTWPTIDFASKGALFDQTRELRQIAQRLHSRVVAGYVRLAGVGPLRRAVTVTFQPARWPMLQVRT